MKYIASILLLVFCTLASGQNIKKGFKSLGKLEYEKAYNEFRGVLADDPDNIAGNFGMALVLADDSSKYFNIIDAWQYIERIEGRMPDLSQDEIEVISEYFLTSEVDKTSRPVKKKIGNALEAIEARLIKYIREENDLEAVYEVLNRYPNFRHYDNVIHIRNQFEYRKYEKTNTRAAYEEFIKKFPDAAQVPKAIRNRNKIAFEEAKTKNTVSAYTSYIVAFPQSEYLQAAIKLRNGAAYAEARRLNTLEAYEEFIQAYPDALEVSDAKSRQQNLLYEQAKRIKSLKAFNDFIEKYPDGQYFVDIFNLKATELGALFLRETNFTNPSIIWAKGFDNNGYIESGGVMAVTPQGDYVLACNTRENDTAWADAWVIKLNAEGKMIWNKTIGQGFEDQVNNILIDSKGDIIVLGYTWLTPDSASRKGWMFKLGGDGKKIWNKNLGSIDIASSAIDNQDRIYLGGSIEKDTLGGFYRITTFNSNAQRTGERIYTGRGEVNDLIINDLGDMFLCGSNWISCMEARRYIKWDVAIDPSLTATAASQSGSGDYYIAGSNTGKIFYARYTADGKKQWFQAYDKSDPAQAIKSISATGSNDLIVLEQKQDGAKIKLFSADGNVKGVKEIFGKIIMEDTENSGGTDQILMNTGDLIMIKFSQLTTL